MEKYVLDTNLFFNLETDLGLGKNSREVIINLSKKIKELKKRKMAEFFFPPSIFEEFLGFFENKNEVFLKEFLSLITVKAPNYGKIDFSAEVFLKLILDIRQRSYRGLTIAEEEVKKAAMLFNGKEVKDKKEFEITIGAVIKKLRERYRQTTRFGFLDSRADLDLIVLSKEINGFLISNDEGVINWGRVFGIKEMPVFLFVKKLEGLLE